MCCWRLSSVGRLWLGAQRWDQDGASWEGEADACRGICWGCILDSSLWRFTEHGQKVFGGMMHLDRPGDHSGTPREDVWNNTLSFWARWRCFERYRRTENVIISNVKKLVKKFICSGLTEPSVNAETVFYWCYLITWNWLVYKCNWNRLSCKLNCTGHFMCAYKCLILVKALISNTFQLWTVASGISQPLKHTHTHTQASELRVCVHTTETKAFTSQT